MGYHSKNLPCIQKIIHRTSWLSVFLFAVILYRSAYAQKTEESSEITPIRFIFIEGSTFEMGDIWNDGYSDDEQPVHTVIVDSFWMSVNEITNAQYCLFMNEVGNPIEGGTHWLDLGDVDCLIEKKNNRYVPKKGFEAHPVVEISWYGARAFAEWAGGRLPTEAEWEFAARNRGRSVKFPNGQHLSHKDANFMGIGDNDRWMRTSPVDSFPANPLGLFDMAGNVWEWCSDNYQSDYYKDSPTKNPTGPRFGEFHVIRGGSWEYTWWNCRTTTRGRSPVDDAAGDVGFRIVRAVDEFIP